MKLLRVVLLVLVVVMSGEGKAGELAFDPLLPEGWRAAKEEAEAVPYGYLIAPGQARGVGVALSGTTNGDKDKFTLYFMPLSYEPADGVLTLPWPARASKGYLGQNAEWRVYFYAPASENPTWPGWKADVRRYFHLEGGDEH